MRVVGAILGVLFMVVGAAGMGLAATLLPQTPLSLDGWICVAEADNVQRCSTEMNNPSEMIAESMWMQSGLIIGAAFFVGGAVLVGGVLASSGRRTPVPAAPAPAPSVPPGPGQQQRQW